MKSVSSVVLAVCALSVSGAMSLVHAANESSVLPVQDAVAVDVVITPSQDEDSDKLMRELCEGYADDEGIVATERDAHIEACLSSMTTDLGNMQESPPSAIEPEETEQPPVALDAQPQASSPEALIAHELVEKPQPGIEELVPKTAVPAE